VPRRRLEDYDDLDRAIEAAFEDERQRLAASVRLLRKARGWSQERLAEEARLSAIYVSHLELARVNVNPTLRALAALAHALGCRVRDLADEPARHEPAGAEGAVPEGSSPADQHGKAPPPARAGSTKSRRGR
jgi:ribosome-binding protein aMBF1 (putative translation factor)